MLFERVLGRLNNNLPFLVSCSRTRVRILPKETYAEDETPYMKPIRRKRSVLTNFLALAHRKNITWKLVKEWRKERNLKEMKQDQIYKPERHQTLGADLAAAHFILFRGGKVRFSDHKTWFTYEQVENEIIPSSYEAAFQVAEVNASGTNLCYEGIENLCNLNHLKALHLRNCSFVDDWCLSRFHLFASTLEYLDLSGCNNVTERGICTLHVLRQLKALVINNMPNIENKELASLLLQEILPKCQVIGVNYNDPVLLKRVEKYMV